MRRVSETAISFIILLAFAKSAYAESQPIEGMAALADDSFKVAVTTGGPMGMIPDHFSPATLKIFEDAADQEYRRLAERSGLQLPKNPKISSKAEIVSYAKSNLLKIVTDYDGQATMLQFIGSIEGTQKSVVCASIEPATFEFDGSKCQAAVISAFGDRLEGVV